MDPIKDRGLEKECMFHAMRSSGPGGQNVNKVATKIELAFQPASSLLLNEDEKKRISEKLASKINEEGFLKITCSDSRSQVSNRELAIEKLYYLLEKALHKPVKRIPTKIPAAVKEGIRKKKQQHSEKKAGRRPVKGDEY